MSLAKLIHRNKTDGIANDRDAGTTTHSNNRTIPTVANVAVAKPTNEKINRDIEKIRTWLFHVGEPEEDHYLVINKCRNDPEALACYSLRHIK